MSLSKGGIGRDMSYEGGPRSLSEVFESFSDRLFVDLASVSSGESGNYSRVYRIDIPIGDDGMFLTSLIKTPPDKISYNYPSAIINLDNEAIIYAYAKTHGVRHMPSLIGYNPDAHVFHLSYIYTQKHLSVEQLVNSSPVSFMRSSIEAVHDFHTKGILLGDRDGCRNMIFFLSAGLKPSCMCIDFGLSVINSESDQVSVYDFNNDIRALVIYLLIYNRNLTYGYNDWEHRINTLMNVDFTPKSANIIRTWFEKSIDSFDDLIESEQRFLKELESIPQTNNLHLPRTSNRLTLVPEPNAYAKALAIQDELNTALMQLRNIDIPIY